MTDGLLSGRDTELWVVDLFAFCISSHPCHRALFFHPGRLLARKMSAGGVTLRPRNKRVGWEYLGIHAKLANSEKRWTNCAAPRRLFALGEDLTDLPTLPQCASGDPLTRPRWKVTWCRTEPDWCASPPIPSTSPSQPQKGRRGRRRGGRRRGRPRLSAVCPPTH